jgi:hypothetical protein
MEAEKAKKREVYCVPTGEQSQIIELADTHLFRVSFNKACCMFICGHCQQAFVPENHNKLSDKNEESIWLHFSKNKHRNLHNNKILKRSKFIHNLNANLFEHGQQEALEQAHKIESDLKFLTGVDTVLVPIEGLLIEWTRGRMCNIEGCNYSCISIANMMKHRREHKEQGTDGWLVYCEKELNEMQLFQRPMQGLALSVQVADIQDTQWTL